MEANLREGAGPQLSRRRFRPSARPMASASFRLFPRLLSRDRVDARGRRPLVGRGDGGGGDANLIAIGNRLRRRGDDASARWQPVDDFDL